MHKGLINPKTRKLPYEEKMPIILLMGTLLILAIVLAALL